VVNPKTVATILNNLRHYQDKLDILADYPRANFLQDFTKVESAKHLLQISIQCCLDIAHHIIADEGYRTPQDSYDAFLVLHEEGIIPDSFMPALRQMVSFRNRAVHLYWDIDDEIIYDILQHDRADFEKFITYILGFMADQSETKP
jgi:uncharacterized protein YutE (UPF0331/DUF86 family)